MSETSLPPSPISRFLLNDEDGTDDDGINGHAPDLSFDGAEDMLRAWSRGIRPDPDLTVSEWADKHRWLSSRAAAEPGRADGAPDATAPPTSAAGAPGCVRPIRGLSCFGNIKAL